MSEKYEAELDEEALRITLHLPDGETAVKQCADWLEFRSAAYELTGAKLPVDRHPPKPTLHDPQEPER